MVVHFDAAGRAVLFAGPTVVIALCGLFVSGLGRAVDRLHIPGLLVVVFRSVPVALKAGIMNLLSMGASCGVIVAVYQWGWLQHLFAASTPGPVDPWIPLMIVIVVFGLSIDYEVFLPSRIREEWLRTGDNAWAVSYGLQSSAWVITAAPAIMVCVFGSFVIGDPLRILDVFGLGLAVAVSVDATIVRMVLVPAVMQLLGPANWWLPRWISRRAPNLDIEGTPSEALAYAPVSTPPDCAAEPSHARLGFDERGAPPPSTDPR